MTGDDGTMIGAVDERIAIVDEDGEHSYAELVAAAASVAAGLLASRPRQATTNGDETDLAGARVALHVPPGFGYVATLLGTWRAGGIAVPLCLTHPDPELAFVLDDTRAELVVAAGDREARLADLAEERGATFRAVDDLIRFSTCTRVQSEGTSPAPAHEARMPAAGRRALILYTSGTTGRPKGVVLTHRNLHASVDALVAAWGWTPDDRIVHVLPLHHTHGIVNALLCALRVGAAVDMLPTFDATAVWDRLSDGCSTLFMAVPTIYIRLIRDWEAADRAERDRRSDGASELRLMVSGSAALPVPVFERWREITGHTLLERYGMTEIGMALSNPLRGERRPGHVGQPLPGVEVKRLDEDGDEVAAGEPGEILVRGPSVFVEYWERPEETAAAFRDGWFCTGDVALIDDGAYRILGRRSVDIIKTGGYKVSALEIENVLGGHPDVQECAVVGATDADWGEAVCAALVSRREIGREELRDWARSRIAPYKLPTRLVRLPALPKNAMGKVTKPELRRLFEAAEEEPG